MLCSDEYNTIMGGERIQMIKIGVCDVNSVETGKTVYLLNVLFL
jgi:hypothetical protein